MHQEAPAALSSAPLLFQLIQTSSGTEASTSRPARPKPGLRPGPNIKDTGSRMRGTLGLSLSLLVCLTLGLLCVGLACVWSSRFRGGFGWDGSGLEFNWHPVLMTTGLVVVYGYASVLYRVPMTWGQSKLLWKLLHAVLMLVALLLSVVGLCAVFDFHNKNHIPNIYSLHSWVGLCAVLLFAVQWGAGFSLFLLPWSPLSWRKAFKPVHVWLGGSILGLSIAACISGINEKLFFVLKGGNHSQPYSDLPSEAMLANSLGIVIVAFGLVVLYVLTNKRWQRPEAQPQDGAYAVS
uniref:Lysosomal membrane ascorbate-dependent ferrireductase CYB561A3 n=1 Tax=Knipowitschia caucasica TaxID=637954 RepID=A0AAV2MPV0_KNICA